MQSSLGDSTEDTEDREHRGQIFIETVIVREHFLSPILLRQHKESEEKERRYSKESLSS
jgi:hypothetical protein